MNSFFGLDGNEPMSLEEIGDKYELTYERIRQIKEKAIKSMQLSARKEKLGEFLG